MSIELARISLEQAIAACIECGRCIPCCEVLEQADGDQGKQGKAGISVGTLAGTFAKAFEVGDDRAIADTPPNAALLARIVAIARNRPDLVFAVRRCCMCGYCTTVCPTGVDARGTFAALRELFALAGVTTGEGFELTQVDHEWHIFSVYRAVYGLYFQDFPHVADARERGADTLFFPGCPLVSYAPDLARSAYVWLRDQGVNAVFSEDCCGSPLKAAGRMERAVAHKRALAASIKEAGIKRIVCVCPGCVDELASADGMEGIELVPLPRLLADAGMKVDPVKVRMFAGTRGVNSEEGKPEKDASPRIAMFDSCHDREGAFGQPLRALFAEESLVELAHHGSCALCCGASGAVSLVDPDLCERRAHRVLDEETSEVAADLLLANCPTCSYTFAAQRRADLRANTVWTGPPHANYLELVFDGSFDWDTIFTQLEDMWTGEYGAWVCQQLL